MKKVLVLYYSRSGNTEKMAKAVAEGIQRSSGIEVELSYHVEAKELSSFDAILIGAPTYRNDMPMDFKNLFDEAATQGIDLRGKLAAVFGSYGWSGQAPQLVADLLKDKFGMTVIGAPLKAKYAPDQNMLNECRDLGRMVAESLMNSA
jgi:flavorubredoxin